MVATSELIKQIMKIGFDFTNARQNYMKSHPDFLRDKDIRLTVYGRFLAIIDMALIQIMFRTFQLPFESWWTSLPNEFRRFGISPVIRWQPDEIDRAKIIDALDNQWLFGLYMLFFAVLENSVRQLIRVVYPTECNDGRGNITKIYQRLLSTNYSKYETALILFRLVRNTSHNNGVYLPTRTGDNFNIRFKDKNYDFIDGKPPQLYDANRLLFFELLPEMLHIIEDIINSTEVLKHDIIVDNSI